MPFRQCPTRALAVLAVCALAACALGGCHETVDSLGYNDAAGMVLHPMKGPDSYPNAFRDLLGKSDAEIAAKIGSAFDQLFHGDPDTQAIYFPVTGQAQAYIQDVYHRDVRTEGMGYGLLICVELGKRDELDRLWSYAKAVLQVTTGAAAGYFESQCVTLGSGIGPCLDPFGLEHLLMALLLAHSRWSGNPGAIDYAAAAKDLLTLMRHKEDQNGGIVDGITNTFDASSKLAFNEPLASSADETRPSIVTPAFYELWGQATADPFWPAAAAGGRALWKRASDPATGLVPVRAHFDGSPVTGAETFAPESYRTQINVVLDRIWTAGDRWEVDDMDRLLRFFIAQGFDKYGSEYSLDGSTVVDASHDASLMVANGIAGLIATIEQRSSFVDAVWKMDIATGSNRYYKGLLQMVALLILAGEMRVY